MSDKTGIEWTNATWNPLRGCRRVSEGCRNCYAERVAARFSGPGQPYEGLAKMTPSGPRWTGTVRLVPELLDQPLRWNKPRMIFVNSMSDLFHENVPFEFIARVFAVMGMAQWHTFQVLTKRPSRMLEFMGSLRGGHVLDVPREAGDELWGSYLLPLRNVWLGVSVEDQAAADERIPLLLKTPAAVRWISAEPLLGPVDLRSIRLADGGCLDALQGIDTAYQCHYAGKLNWVVVGGESGPNARPMHPDWARSLRDQCVAARVPYFFKQWGEFLPRIGMSHLDKVEFLNTVRGKAWGCLDVHGNYQPETTTWNGTQDDPDYEREVTVYRVGKHAAGRLLDGQEWSEYPTK